MVHLSVGIIKRLAMSIDQIKIKNFRSLAEVNIDCKALTVFVGSNDEGKSNILRSLDLFFNHENGRYKFNWTIDFSGYAKLSTNKAKQIEVSLTFTLPTSFNIKQQIVWKKTWRKEGIHDELIKLADGSDLPRRSKAYIYLKSIRYEYVPAIKGSEYFGKLLGAVHDMLDATVQEDIRNAAASFTIEIRKHTNGILKDLKDKIGIESDLELPTDLNRLFSELEFKSTVGANRVALSQRGDGIKVRHIPIILNWLAEQANHLSAPGKPRVVTIWGYEEPENNLETKKCFELADYFLDNSKITQTFLTTHSPVFYSAFKEPDSTDISISEVRLISNEGTRIDPRSLVEVSDVEALHSSMGFLELLEPHVKFWKSKVEHLQARIDEGISTQYPSIFVEGPTDQIVIKAVIKRFFNSAGNVRVLSSSSGGGGHSWVKDSLIAWHYSRPQEKAIGLFDGDEAAAVSVNEFQNLVEKIANGKTKAFKYRLNASGNSLQVVKVGLQLPIAIEEISPKEIWLKARDENWLEDRAGLTKLYKFEEVDITFNEWLHSKLDDDFLLLMARKRVKVESKIAFSKYLATKIKDEKCKYDFAPLVNMVGELLKRLDISLKTS